MIVLLFVGSLSACKVTSEKIQTWKRSQHGEAKLRTAVMDRELETSLRIEAAQALTDLSFVSYLAKDLETLPAVDRTHITSALVKSLLSQMSGTSEQRTSKVQLQAKDTLFALRMVFDAPTRTETDKAVVHWIAGDWMERRRGEHSAQKVVKGIGQSAGGYLAERVGADPKVVNTIAELIRKQGTAAHRAVAAARLLKLVAEQDPPMKQTFAALGTIGTNSTRTYLLKVAREGRQEKYRLWAFWALKADPNPASVGVLAFAAGNAKEARNVRGAAFEALEKINAPAAAKALAEIITREKGETVRYRAVEAIIQCCKVAGVRNLLAALPPQFNYNEADVVDLIEKDIKALGKSVLPALRKGLRAQSWISRVVAVRLIGQLGVKTDIEALEKFIGDRTRLKGWSTGATLGSEAKAAIEQLKK
ncbi:MAG: HEAT repeat domain-containing protein [Deltaproteobacteria bacterium]|nr:HEAT repeat domain-containing protein [Deltaproteobacteria bacterium]